MLEKLRLEITKIKYMRAKSARNTTLASTNFMYLITEDMVYLKILSSILKRNIAKYPNGHHLVFPQYGIRFYNDPKLSKFPRILKLLANFVNDSLLEYKRNKESLNRLRLYINNEEIYMQIAVVPIWAWIIQLIKSNVRYFIKQPVSEDFSNELSFIEKFKFGEIPVGDLIADSYIRYKGEARFELKSRFTNELSAITHALIGLYQAYSKGLNRKGYFFGQYSTYVHHGIPLRFAFYNEWKCATFASSTSFFKVHEHTNLALRYGPRHTEDHTLYSGKQAANLPIQIIEKSREILKARTFGVYDNTMDYMNNNIQSDTGIRLLSKDRINGMRIIMLHDFFDSVHVYNWLLFPDFWSWCTNTIDFCIANNLPILIKPHPNQIEGSEKFCKNLRAIYANQSLVQWLNPQIKNNEIFKKNPSLLISVYGSVVAESAFCNIPVLLAGDHPAYNFKLGFTANTLEQYYEYLLKPQRSMNSDLKEKSVLFTALHNQKMISSKGDSLKAHFNLRRLNQADLNRKLLSKELSNYLNENIIQLSDQMGL